MSAISLRIPALCAVVCAAAGAFLAAACGGSTGPRETFVQYKHLDGTLSAFFEETFQRGVDRSPMFQTYLGIKTDYGKWDDMSERRAVEDLELAKADLARLQRFDPHSLTPENRLSLQLAIHAKKPAIEGFRWRFHNYPVNQMYGLHSRIPAFLGNQHKIDNVADAEAYISRLQGIAPLFKTLEENLRARQEKGVLPPKFVFPKVILDSQNVITGAPFDKGDDSVLLRDFTLKLIALKATQGLEDAQFDDLREKAAAALRTSVGPAYRSLIALVKTQEQAAGTDDGVWRLPGGSDFYEFALRRTTTTAMTAADVHATGLKEVARIHAEMREIMRATKFKGSLQDFFNFMRKDKRFVLANNEEGKAAYLSQAKSIIATMEARLPEVFATLPKAPLEVRPVESYREKSAGKAFYNGPAPDGTRPGIYYANLYDMTDMPTYQMEALAYHEAVPGHHMQIAIAQELTELPKFRRFGGYTAYSEGWGLYSEYLPKEMGFYQDPYSDFGRLAMELWRACRLVVDTGLHKKKWTREKAIEYLASNTPNPRGDVVKAIERYIVMPSQATAYKIGMLKILALRRKAKDALGEKFDLRAFHDVVLRSGPVPLQVLESVVDDWLASQGANG